MATTSWLGQVIRDLRHERGWTQNDLAGYAGVHPLTILRIEHNHQVGSMRVISLLLDALGYELEVMRKK